MSLNRVSKIFFRSSLLPVLIGIVFFLLITGGQIFKPTSIVWLLQDDPATNWLGWQFFRYLPILQWPMGINPNYGMEMSSSIVYTDSIPLLALIFKPFSLWLPQAFQYLGFWLLLCFILQAYFAWKLLSLFTNDKWLPIIGCIFFTVAPAWLWRLNGHYALCGQWVLVAGFYLYFSKTFSFFRWLSILIMTPLIHAYFMVMVYGIFIADLIQRLCLKQEKLTKIIYYFFSAAITTILVMWMVGYFILGNDVQGLGFGIYHMNLWSVLDPDEVWSRILPDLKGEKSDYEGFSYLGLGMLGLSVISVITLFKRRSHKPATHFQMIPLILLCFGFLLFSLSNRISLGQHEIFTYTWPTILEPFSMTFRASGRFFWPVYYCIYVAIFYLIFSRLKPKIAILLCSSLLLCQLMDSTDMWKAFRNKFNHPPRLVELSSPIWSEIGARYKRIIYVFPEAPARPWVVLSKFAMEHKMAINTGNFARYNIDNVAVANNQIIKSIISNEYDRDALYIFNDAYFWNLVVNQLKPNDVAGTVDGFRILAPNFKNCRTCNTANIQNIKVQSDSRFHEYSMGERVFFNSNKSGSLYAMYGWSQPEEFGTWSDGSFAALALRLKNAPKKDVELLIRGRALLLKIHPVQRFDIFINNIYLATWKYDDKTKDQILHVQIPKALIAKYYRFLVIQFNFKDAVSLMKLKISPDMRRLSLGLEWFELKEKGS